MYWRRIALNNKVYVDKPHPLANGLSKARPEEAVRNGSSA